MSLARSLSMDFTGNDSNSPSHDAPTFSLSMVSGCKMHWIPNAGIRNLSISEKLQYVSSMVNELGTN